MLGNCLGEMGSVARSSWAHFAPVLQLSAFSESVCCDQQKVLPAENRDGLRVEPGCGAVLAGGRS